MSGIGHRWLYAAAVISAVAFSPAATAGEIDAPAQAILEAAFPADGPGGAAIVTRRGEVVYVGARGLADISTGRPIDVDTTFRLGSITKQFTAALTLKLVDQGRLSLDDPLSKFVPGYPEPGGHVTVRQLLNHTSGIQSYTSIPGWMVEANTSRAFTTTEMIAEFRDKPAQFEPGTSFAYNNSGYVLLAAVVEAVTGKPWYDALEEQITGPLGLTTIRYGIEESTIADRALPYSGAPGSVRPAQAIHMSVPSGAGALVGSVRDLARWAEALHGGRVLSAQSYAQMIAPTALPGGQSVPYGFGLGTGEVRGLATIGHNGGIFGGKTDSQYVPSEGIFVAVFENTDAPLAPPDVIVRRLGALAAGRPYPEFVETAVDPASLEPLFGLYRDPQRNVDIAFYSREGQFFLRAPDGPEARVRAAGDDRFFWGPNALAWFALRRDDSGVPVLELRPNGEDQPLRMARSGPIPPPSAVERAVLERYVGRYAINGTVATIGIAEDGRLTSQLAGQPVGILRTAGPNEFWADSVGVRIAFEGDGPKASTIRTWIGPQEVVGERLPD